MTDFTRSGHVTLGRTYRDHITGYVGVACGRHEYLTGCVRFALEAKAEAGKVPDEAVFDEGRLEEVVQDGVDAEGKPTWVAAESFRTLGRDEDSEAPPAKGGPRTTPSRTVPSRTVTR